MSIAAKPSKPKRHWLSFSLRMVQVAIPGYALMPQGWLCAMTVYYRNFGGPFEHPSSMDEKSLFYRGKLPECPGEAENVPSTSTAVQTK